MDIKALAQEVFEDVVALRRDIHRHPELSLQEFRTTDKIAEKMEELGIPYRRFEPTGLVAEIKGGKPGGTVMLRADIDALPVIEKSGVEFASEIDGMMHACGHDTHVAMLYGAGKILNGMKDELCGTVKLLFQPAEEGGQGAKKVIAQGALEGVDMIFGIHSMAQNPVGILGTSAGATAAASDRFTLDVYGESCHGAMPEKGADATVAAAAILLNLQTIVSREVAAQDLVVVTVGSFHSGEAANVVSGHAVLKGTCRSFDRDIHAKLPEMIGRIAEDTAKAFRCRTELEYVNSIEILYNDQEATELAHKAAKKVVAVPQMAVLIDSKGMGSEDFAEYTALVKGNFSILGCGGEHPQHSDKFYVDEKCFLTGVAYHVQVALDALESLGK